MAIHVLKDPELRSARDDFKLKDFYKKTSEQRRSIWFSALHKVSGGLRELHGEEQHTEPIVAIMVELLATTLRDDLPPSCGRG